jgi:hypothetical protein
MSEHNQYNAEALYDVFLNNIWYRECHKECAWSDWCPHCKNMTKCDMQCGFVTGFVKDLAISQEQLISTLCNTEQEDYINGLITFIKFIDRFFERFTHLQNEGILDFYKEYGAHTFTKGFIKTILHDLQNANLLFNKVIKSNNLVFLVEGQSEEAFIKNYYQHFDGDVSVYSYKGEGNAKGGNLHILIDFFLENNHAVFVQVDLDNKNNKHQQLEKHKEKYKDKDVYFFAFKNNLEESYPYELVTEALGHIYSDFDPKMLGNKETTYKDLLARIDINIDDIKIDLAIIIAQLVYRKGRRGVHFNANDEIYGFADFIDNAYPKSQEKSKYYNYWKDEEQQNNER